MSTQKLPKGWNEVLREIKAAGVDLEHSSTKHCELWYRGSPRSSYSLLPSLFRGYPAPNRSDMWDHIWQQEQDLYWEFASRARQLHGKIDNDWDILFTMRHYGVPTRILDWTETLGVAVFMALHDFVCGTPQPLMINENDPPCVWVLNPYELNYCSFDGKEFDLYAPKNLGWDPEANTYYGYRELLLEEGIGWKGPVALYPEQRNDRMQAQRGWFTIHGDDFAPIDERKDKDKFLRKIVIPAAAQNAAQEFLKDAGLELFVLFPDLQGLAEHLTRQYAAERKKFLAP